MFDPLGHWRDMQHEELRQRLARELQRAVVDRHHAWRTPVLASVDGQGHPAARTVVLRAVQAEGARLHVYTDGRSPKTHELTAHPRAALVFWSERLKIQLRVHATAVVHHQGPMVTQAWERMRQAPSAGDYLSARAPGEPLQPASDSEADRGSAGSASDLQAADLEAALGLPAQLSAESAAHHLAVIELQVRKWDALLLHREGHARIEWGFDDSGSCGAGRALVP